MATKERKQRCPYCSRLFTRKRFPSHLDSQHPDKIPEGWSALRLAYHIINKRPLEYRRKCKVCGNPTSWDENKGRYNFLCDNPACKKKWQQISAERFKNNVPPTKSAEGQKKMLAHRKISGTYIWSDGTKFTYTGSYEHDTLKFMDKVLDIRSEDLEVPGPVLKYLFNGEEHMYITDLYYRPYNLVIEVKDGGDNPNKNQAYALTRAKQMCKEKWIIEKTDYNYLRLTDKDFSQLMSIFADLKMHCVEHDDSRVIHVNENSAIAGISPIVGFVPSRDVMIINYMKKNVFNNDSDYAVSFSPKFDTIFARENGRLIKTDKSFLEDTNYTSYIVDNKENNTAENVKNAIRESLDRFIDKDFIYESVFGHPCYSEDQIMFEENAKIYDYYSDLKNIAESVYNSLKADPYDSKNIVLRRFGVISSDGAYNCCLEVKGYPKLMRGRSSMIILKKIKDEYYAYFKYEPNENGHNYSAPGGGWNENENPMHAAIREAEEEVRITPIDVKYEGTLIEYHPEAQQWVKDHVIDRTEWWYGYFSEIFVGMYGGKFTGEVKEEDKDPEHMSSEWYPVQELFKDKGMPKEYSEAIINYITERKLNDKEEYNINESYIKNEPDIYYNKDKFDSGEINLCFITGLSGSGKSTMAKDMQKNGVEHYELDDLQCIEDHFTMDQLKEYGDLIYSYFSGPGKQFYVTYQYLVDNKVSGADYEDKLFPEFVHYAMQYAKQHKDRKYVIEGVWLFEKAEGGDYYWFEPEEFKDYAFYIKGTSALISKIRSSKRDSQDAEKGISRVIAFGKNLFKNWKWFFLDEKHINHFREYFKKLIKENKNNG